MQKTVVAQESRVERKQRLARERIIEAAEALMRTHPIDDVTVSQITNAADVGHGTFYTHFKSKKDVLIPITRQITERWDRKLQARFTEDSDPAEIVGISTRLMGRAVLADPFWRWMLRHSGVPVDDIRNAIGRFAARDFRRGFESDRFRVADMRIVNSFIVGGFVACLLASFNATDPERQIDLMAELLLRTLGISQSEADEIAHAPLPPVTLS